MLAQATGESLKWIAEWVGFELMSFFKKTSNWFLRFGLQLREILGRFCFNKIGKNVVSVLVLSQYLRHIPDAAGVYGMLWAPW